MTDDENPVDPLSIVRSREYLQALVLAALIAIPVAIVVYGFLVLVDWLQEALFDDLPGGLGFDTTPVWWPVPLLALSQPEAASRSSVSPCVLASTNTSIATSFVASEAI